MRYLYKGSVHGLAGLVTFVEFDEIFVGEWNCGHPEESNPKKCAAKQYEANVVRKLIMINSNLNFAYHIEKKPRHSIISVATLGSGSGVASSIEGSIKNARKKIKSAKQLKQIKLPQMALDELNCTSNKDKKSKEYSLECQSTK